MRILTTRRATTSKSALLAAAILFASPVSAQSLGNANFEKPWSANPPTGSVPVEWGVLWPVDFAEPVTSVNEIHAGTTACALDTSAFSASLYHFGKQWNDVPIGTNLSAKVRFLCTATGGATIKIHVGEWDTNWVFQGGMVHTVTASPNWQEVTLKHTTILGPSSTSVPNRLRFLLSLQNAPASRIVLDHIDFSGSSTGTLGSLDPRTTFEIKSSSLGHCWTCKRDTCARSVTWIPQAFPRVPAISSTAERPSPRYRSRITTALPRHLRTSLWWTTPPPGTTPSGTPWPSRAMPS